MSKETKTGISIVISLCLIILAFASGPITYKISKDKIETRSQELHKQANIAHKLYIKGETIICINYNVKRATKGANIVSVKNMNVINKKVDNFKLNENNNKYDYFNYTFESKFLSYPLANCELFIKEKDYHEAAKKKKFFIPDNLRTSPKGK